MIICETCGQYLWAFANVRDYGQPVRRYEHFIIGGYQCNECFKRKNNE